MRGDPQSDALIYTVVSHAHALARMYHLISLSNQAARPTKPTPNTTTSIIFNTPLPREWRREREKRQKSIMIKVSQINQTVWPSRPAIDRQVKKKYLFTSCQGIMFSHIIIHWPSIWCRKPNWGCTRSYGTSGNKSVPNFMKLTDINWDKTSDCGTGVFMKAASDHQTVT